MSKYRPGGWEQRWPRAGIPLAYITTFGTDVPSLSRSRKRYVQVPQIVSSSQEKLVDKGGPGKGEKEELVWRAENEGKGREMNSYKYVAGEGKSTGAVNTWYRPWTPR